MDAFGHLDYHERIAHPEALDVHTEHCCLMHGCKYRDINCTVMNGRKKQSTLCESCRYEGITSMKMFNDVLNGNVKRCPHCDHVL